MLQITLGMQLENTSGKQINELTPSCNNHRCTKPNGGQCFTKAQSSRFSPWHSSSTWEKSCWRAKFSACNSWAKSLLRHVADWCWSRALCNAMVSMLLKCSSQYSGWYSHHATSRLVHLRPSELLQTKNSANQMLATSSNYFFAAAAASSDLHQSLMWSLGYHTATTSCFVCWKSLSSSIARASACCMQNHLGQVTTNWDRLQPNRKGMWGMCESLPCYSSKSCSPCFNDTVNATTSLETVFEILRAKWSTYKTSTSRVI